MSTLTSGSNKSTVCFTEYQPMAPVFRSEIPMIVNFSAGFSKKVWSMSQIRNLTLLYSKPHNHGLTNYYQ